jgi:3',5'-cyclic AMP phosphodiesterase CpdA
MRLAWLTDIHLNFLTEPKVEEFAHLLRAAHADAALVTGDIAEAPTLEASLRTLARHSGTELFYVLGNHDFYRGRIEAVRQACRALPFGTYLHGGGVHALTDRLGLVGVDGWSDGGFGRPRESDLVFTDWYLIEDFREVDAITNVDNRMEMVQRLAAESAEALRVDLEAAAERFPRVLVLTHVPPFERAAGHNGSALAELWVPWLACRATGEVIAEIAEGHPAVEFEVLCGHTHVARVTHPRLNVTVRTGAASYGEPAIQRVWTAE